MEWICCTEPVSRRKKSIEMKRSILIAALGVLVGILSVLTVQKLTENKKRLRAEYADWRKLNLVLQTVGENYVDSVDFASVSDAAINAALGSLDPHSVYMPPVELERAEDDLAANFDGIGIQFNVPNDTAVVIEVIAGGPSEKIGLRSGDRILKVDSTVIAGVHFPQDSMVRRMKGPAGTKVLITVGREGESIPFEITRGKIPVHSVDASFMVDDTTAYIRLSKFSRSTYSEVASAAQSLLEQGMKSLVFDLRDNSGGYFDQALLLSDLFLPKDSQIVYLQGLHRKREDYKASGRGFLKDITLRVLINEGSASSAEIFTGAMQDNGRATVIGRRSFGKGLVQEPVYFTDGSGIRLTVARFHTPSGRCIQKPYTDDYDYEVYKRYGEGEMMEADSMKLENGGILPDIFVPLDTTRAPHFYIEANKKATAMRFAASFFDSHRHTLAEIDDFAALSRFFENAGLEQAFLSYAADVDGIRPENRRDWEENRDYMMAQVRGLTGRYSRLGENAFYHFWLPVDNIYQVAVGTTVR